MQLAIVICLIALTGSAFSTATYGAPYGNFLPQPAAPRVSGGYEQELSARGRLESKNMELEQINTIEVPIQQSYGAPLTVPKTLPIEAYAAPAAPAVPVTYGSVSYAPQTEQRTLIPILSEADILCQGRPAETIIPVDNSRKFVVCIDDGKGTIQDCPKGLFFHRVTLRCERTLGELEDACISQPCLNGGQCLTAGSSYQCQCTAGYDGVNCELDARVCQTQQPCGSYAKCQSFRTGAALSHMCIFQDGLAYGLNAQQTFQSPCSTVSGPYALAVNNLGFIMCDGERMFIESCPGGTIWDDVEKACSWPDLKVEAEYAPQAYGSSYGPAPSTPKVFDSYGQAPAAPMIVQSYAPAPAVPRIFDSYGQAPATPKVFNSYGQAPATPKVFNSYAPAPTAPKFFDSYAPAPAAPKFFDSYAPAPAAPKVFNSYGQAPATPKVFNSYAPAPTAPKFFDSYAPAPVAPKVFNSYGQAPATPKVFNSYAPAPTAPKVFDSYAPAPVAPKVFNSYGPAPATPKVFDSYAPAPAAPKFIQSYAPAMPVAQSYGAEISTPRQLLSKILTKHSSNY